MCQEKFILTLSDEQIETEAKKVLEAQSFKRTDTSFDIARDWLAKSEFPEAELSSILMLSEKLEEMNIGKIEKVLRRPYFHGRTYREKRAISN